MTSKSSQPSARALSMTHSPSPELPKRTPSHHARATPLLDLEPRVTWQRLCGENLHQRCTDRRLEPLPEVDQQLHQTLELVSIRIRQLDVPPAFGPRTNAHNTA